MTRNAAIHQWNDLYFTDGDHEMFRQFVALFKDMSQDYDTRQEPWDFCGVPTGPACDDSVDKHTAVAFPRVSRPKDDLVVTMLDRIQCLTPDPVTGKVKRTRLALSMHTMRGARGNYLAEAIRQKWVQGCDVRVSYGLIGYHTKGAIAAPTKRGRIPLRSTGMDYNLDDNFDLNNDGVDDLILDYYSHQKYFIDPGHLQRRARHLDGPDRLGELVEPEHGQRRGVVHREGREGARTSTSRTSTTSGTTPATPATPTRRRTPTSGSAARCAQPDGTVRTVWRTVRRPVTTVEPDHYLPGPYWEAD